MPESLQQLLVTNFGLSPSGYTGSRGDTGYVGSGGLGYTGSRGTDGVIGVDGATGPVGYTGSAAAGGGSGSSISNGTSNVVVALNGNVSTSIGNISNVMVVTTTGIRVTGNVNAGNGYFTGNVFSSYSDVRLKTILGTIEHPTDKVRQIETFYYKPNDLAVSMGMPPGYRQIGVSAQSVQSVVPEAVAPSPIDQNYLTVQYERLVPLLIEAVKELTAEVEQLKKQLGSK